MNYPTVVLQTFMCPDARAPTLLRMAARPSEREINEHGEEETYHGIEKVYVNRNWAGYSEDYSPGPSTIPLRGYRRQLEYRG
jgi:hypothetical protein